MQLNEWLDTKLPDISLKLTEINKKNYYNDNIIGIGGKEIIYHIINLIRSSFFPGVYDKNLIEDPSINIIIGNQLREASIELYNLIYKVLNFSESDSKVSDKKAQEIVIELMEELPKIREILQTDIIAAYEGDPAAKSFEEIIMSYPSLEAISIYRVAHFLYKKNIPLIPRIMTEYAHQKTGIDIHPGAQIGNYFFIDHGTGVVIGETTVIGNRVKLYQGVTLGAKSFALDEKGLPIKNIKRHPNIEDNVVIYAGATILGGDTTIGHDSIIGGNVWLTHSVPPYSKVYNSQPEPNICTKPKVCDE